MKKTISYLTIVVILTILLNTCSSSNDESPDNGGEDAGQTLSYKTKYLTSIRNKDFHDKYGYDSDTLVYHDGKLSKAVFYSCSGQMHQFEYGGNGKISRQYSTDGFAFDYSLDVDLKNKTDQYRIRRDFEYDELNRVDKITENRALGNEEYSFFSEIQIAYNNAEENWVNFISYSDVEGVIFNSSAEKFDDNGNVTEESDGKAFRYDDSINPFYILFQEFGLFYIESCSHLDNGFLTNTLNNLRGFKLPDGSDGCFEAVYSPDSDKYPISVNARSCGDGEVSMEYYSYIEL